MTKNQHSIEYILDIYIKNLSETRATIVIMYEHALILMAVRLGMNIIALIDTVLAVSHRDNYCYGSAMRLLMLTLLSQTSFSQTHAVGYVDIIDKFAFSYVSLQFFSLFTPNDIGKSEIGNQGIRMRITYQGYSLLTN